MSFISLPCLQSTWAQRKKVQLEHPVLNPSKGHPRKFDAKPHDKRNVSEWGECLYFCQNAIKMIQMGNSKAVPGSVCWGAGAAGSWVPRGGGTEGQTPALPWQGSHRLSGRCWHRQPAFVQHTETRRGKSLREKSTNLRPDLKIWFKWEQFPSSEKKRQKKCPFCNSTLFAWEISFFSLRNKSMW